MAYILLSYLCVEAVNIIYTARFGIQTLGGQPSGYKGIRLTLFFLKYGLAIASAINLFIAYDYIFAIVILLAPFVIEKILYQYCLNRTVNKMAKGISERSKGDKEPLTYEQAKRAARHIVEGNLEDRQTFF